MTRRQLLAGAAGAFAFRADTLRSLDRFDFGQLDPADDDFWLKIRSQFDIDPEITVFNHAGLSPSPIVVREAIEAQTKRANSDPSFHIWRRQDNELGPVRDRLAKLVGCETDELALTMNCTYGLQTGLMGVPMTDGDEFLTTSHDYPRSFTAMRQRQRRDGTKLTSVPIASPPEPRLKVAKDILDKVAANTRLVLLSQMTIISGQLMPVNEVAEGLRGKDMPLFVDAAHGIGLLSETFREMGADIYAACLHKWLMGPIGTGVFVVRKPWIEKVWPLHPADADLDRSMRKFEQIGTRPAAPYLAIKEALDFHEMLGIERKAARLEELRRRLAERILNLPGAIHYRSLDPSVCRAILLVGLKGIQALQLGDWLYSKHRIHVTTMARLGVNAIRISPNVFTTDAEVDKLASALDDAARNGIT